ncbi:unnamed protein product [Rhizopus microsporus]
MLANSLNQPQLVEAIDVYAEDSSDKAVTDNDENDNLLDAETSEVAQDFGSRKKYEAAMNFVAKFKEKKSKRMDWTACVEEENYKNTNFLLIQFTKRIRNTFYSSIIFYSHKNHTVAIVEGEDEVATRPGKFEWQRSLAFPTQKEA